MKNCPKCGELIGDNATNCFNCHYNYNLGRVMTIEEKADIQKLADEKIEKKKSEELKKKQTILEYQGIIRNNERLQTQDEKDIIALNDIYQYDLVTVTDKASGESNIEGIKNVLNNYSLQGWKLVSVSTNELGKNLSSIGIGGLSVGTNSTVEQTVLIFERCVKRYNSH